MSEVPRKFSKNPTNVQEAWKEFKTMVCKCQSCQEINKFAFAIGALSVTHSIFDLVQRHKDKSSGNEEVWRAVVRKIDENHVLAEALSEEHRPQKTSQHKH